MLFKPTVQVVTGAAILSLLAGCNPIDVGASLFSQDNITVNEERFLDGKSANQVEIRTEITDVLVSATDEKEVHVLLQGEMSEKLKEKLVFNAENRGDTVSITATFKTSTFTFDASSFHDAKLEVKLPRKLYDRFAAKSATGNISVKNIQVKEIEVKSETGNITIQDHELGKSIEANSDTGDIVLERVQGELHAESDTGNVTVEMKKITDDLTMESNTGDIQLRAALPESYELDLQTETGEVQADDIPMDKVNTKEAKEVAGSLGSAGPRIQMTSMTGDILIR